jgi:hypothetical protein
MSPSAQLQAPDLRTSFPRSPNALVGPYILLGRILDKCRATIAGSNGEYNYNCPLDRRFFDFFSVDAEAFKAEVAQGKTDEEMVSWVKANSAAKTDEDILVWAYKARWARPEEPQMIAYFEGMRRQVAPNNSNVETWFQLLDAEEGRF